MQLNKNNSILKRIEKIQHQIEQKDIARYYFGQLTTDELKEIIYIIDNNGSKSRIAEILQRVGCKCILEEK